MLFLVKSPPPLPGLILLEGQCVISGHQREGWSGGTVPSGLPLPHAHLPRRKHTWRVPPSSHHLAWGHQAGYRQGREGPLFLRGACMCLPPALAGLSPYLLLGFSTHRGFFSLLAPSAACSDSCDSVGGISFLSQPHRSGDLSSGLHRVSTPATLASSIPPPPQCWHLSWGHGFLFLEHWLVFLLPAFPPFFRAPCLSCQSRLGAWV